MLRSIQGRRGQLPVSLSEYLKEIHLNASEENR